MQINIKEIDIFNVITSKCFRRFFILNTRKKIVPSYGIYLAAKINIDENNNFKIFEPVIINDSV